MAQIASGLENNHTERKLPTMIIFFKPFVEIPMLKLILGRLCANKMSSLTLKKKTLAHCKQYKLCTPQTKYHRTQNHTLPEKTALQKKKKDMKYCARKNMRRTGSGCNRHVCGNRRCWSKDILRTPCS